MAIRRPRSAVSRDVNECWRRQAVASHAIANRYGRDSLPAPVVRAKKSHPAADGLICWRLLSGLELGHRSVEFAGELVQTAGGICRVTDGGGTFFRHLGDGFDFVRNVVAGVALLGN